MTNQQLMIMLTGYQTWCVYIFNNFYTGSRYEYCPHGYLVIASSEAQARQVVLDNAADIMEDLKQIRQNGRRIIRKSERLGITAKALGVVKNGITHYMTTTTKPKRVFTPNGVRWVMLNKGHIVDMKASLEEYSDLKSKQELDTVV